MGVLLSFGMIGRGPSKGMYGSNLPGFLYERQRNRNNDNEKSWELSTHPRRCIAALMNRERTTGEGRRLAN